VTLCFLGAIAAGEVAGIATAVRSALDGRPAPSLTLGEPLWLPPRRPRVLAVALDDLTGALGALQSAVSAALVRGGWYEEERRPFLAHVTVARVRRDGPRRPPPLDEGPALAGDSDRPAGSGRAPGSPRPTRARCPAGSQRPTSSGRPAPGSAPAFSADRVSLMRSHTGAGGARYEPLATVVLDG
jgi:2'-5' RNA ligase